MSEHDLQSTKKNPAGILTDTEGGFFVLKNIYILWGLGSSRLSGVNQVLAER